MEQKKLNGLIEMIGIALIAVYVLWMLYMALTGHIVHLNHI